MKPFTVWKRLKWNPKIGRSTVSTTDYILFLVVMTMLITKFWNSFRPEPFVPQHSNIGDFPGPEGYN